MARSISVIHQQMLTAIAADPNLSDLSSTSKVALYRLFAYVMAVSIWTLDKLFDIHTDELSQKLRTQKSGVLSWYRTMALRFQFGFTLVEDQDYFDNGIATPEEIEASKVIKYAAVNEAEESSRVIIKIAGETAGVLAPVSGAVEVAFAEYIKDVRWAGVAVEIINYLPDLLYLMLQIKYDPLLLTNAGQSILNGNYPVNEALNEFMKELKFDGELRLSALVDKLQAVAGVEDATVLNAQSAWIDPLLGGYGLPENIFISKVAESGYYKIDNFDSIEYVV